MNRHNHERRESRAYEVYEHASGREKVEGRKMFDHPSERAKKVAHKVLHG